MHVMIICQVHFERDMKHFNDNDIWSFMQNLLRALKETVEKIFDNLLKDKNVKMQNWAKNKQVIWMLVRLNSFYIKMNREFFMSHQKIMNEVESNH